jgi:hypothetical protein
VRTHKTRFTPFDVVTQDVTTGERFQVTHCSILRGYLPPEGWRSLENFSRPGTTEPGNPEGVAKLSTKAGETPAPP